MKYTVITLSVGMMFFLVWFVFAAFFAWITDESLKASMLCNASLGFMLVIGWLPSLAIYMDLQNRML